VTSEVLDKRQSEDGRTLVTWHADGMLRAWERGTAETHHEVRASGWARVDTHRPPAPPDPEDIGAVVGAAFDHEVVHRVRAVSLIYGLYPEVYSRSIESRGFVRAHTDPASTLRHYEADVRAKRSGVKPPPEARSGAGVGPGGLGAVRE